MHKGVRRRRIRKDDSEINPVVKYLLFGFNVIFWVFILFFINYFFEFK